MTAPVWVTRQQAERLHFKVIEAAGGSHGIRDARLLESALARPMNQHVTGDADNFQLAAGYAEGMSRNHAFVDGNKRTAFAVADFSYAEMAMPDKLVNLRVPGSHLAWAGHALLRALAKIRRTIVQRHCGVALR